MGKKYTEAQKRAYKKYSDSTDEIRIRIPKGMKMQYQDYALSHGETLNQFVLRCLDAAIGKDREE